MKNFWFISKSYESRTGSWIANEYMVNLSGAAPIRCENLKKAKQIAIEHGASGKWVRSEKLNGRRMQVEYTDAKGGDP